jgi:hypothetical protein
MRWQVRMRNDGARLKRTPLDRVRNLCLALPETSERLSHGEPAWFVRDKLFATWENHHHGDPIVGLWVKGAPGLQEILVENEPERYYRPKYVGHKGWIGVNMEPAGHADIDWPQVEDLIRESWRMTAPKKLVATTSW